MLKKLLLAALVLVGLSVNAAAEDKVKKLPAPSTESEVSLMEAVNKRQSRREFSPKAVDVCGYGRRCLALSGGNQHAETGQR